MSRDWGTIPFLIEWSYREVVFYFRLQGGPGVSSLPECRVCWESPRCH